MADPDVTGINAGEQFAKGGAGDRLRALIREWENLRDRIRELAESGGRVTNAPEYQRLVEKRKGIVDSIQQIVEENPRLRDNAINLGFREDLLQSQPGGINAGEAKANPDDHAAGQPGGGSGGGGGGGSSGGGQGGGGSGSGGGGGGGGSAGVNANRFLPGVKGKDFRVERFKGAYYVTYEVKVGGKSISVSWRVPQNKLSTYGIKEGEGRQLTRAQAKKRNFFGLAEDILVHGEKRHPFRQWVEKVTAQYGGTGLLKNREIMSILLMGYTEGWDQESIKGKIRQTKWWQNSTQHSRRWNFELTDKEKNLTINSMELKMREFLQSQYGDNWMKYVSENEIKKNARKIASGRFGLEGNPDDAFSNWSLRQQNRAEKVMGTPAQVAADEQRQSVVNSAANPEVMRAQLEAQAREWLGPRATPDQGTIQKWANALAGGGKSQTEFDNWLRRQKQALHKYLDPDETWTDRASTYKSLAERILGTTIGFDDRLLTNLEAVGPNGAPDPMRAISMDEFEQRIRQTNRFWDSDTAKQEGQGLVALMENAFLGKAS